MKSAFTLVELTIVLVIVAILAMVAYPTSESSNNLKVTQAAELIATHLRYAQQLSITTGNRHGVSFDTAQETYRVYRDDTPDGSGTIANDPNDPANPGNNNDATNPGKLVIDLKKEPYKTVGIDSAIFNDGAANRTKVIFDTFGTPQADNDGTNPNLITGVPGNNTVTLSRGGSTRTVTVEPAPGKVTVQ